MIESIATWAAWIALGWIGGSIFGAITDLPWLAYAAALAGGVFADTLLRKAGL